MKEPHGAEAVGHPGLVGPAGPSCQNSPGLGRKFVCSHNTTHYGIRSIHYSGVRLWNSLPIESKNQTLYRISGKN